MFGKRSQTNNACKSRLCVCYSRTLRQALEDIFRHCSTRNLLKKKTPHVPSSSESSTTTLANEKNLTPRRTSDAGSPARLTALYTSRLEEIARPQNQHLGQPKATPKKKIRKGWEKPAAGPAEREEERGGQKWTTIAGPQLAVL